MPRNDFCRRHNSQKQINCKQDLGVIKFIEVKPLVLTHARQNQVTKIDRKTTSALEPQNTV